MQRGLWVAAGGQPGHRAAWLDPEADRLTDGYHADTLSALDEAWLRPRHDGYIPFQDEAGHVVHAYLREGGDPLAVLDDLDRLYHQSLPGGARA